MSISSRITEMEQHIGNAYDKIEDLGIDLTDVDKNIDNISSMLENVWNEYPKVTASDVEEATLNGTKKGRMEIDLKGQTEQDTLTGKNLLGLVDGTYTNNGITAIVENGKITINGTATNTSFIPINLLKNIELSNQTVTVSTNNSTTAGDNLTELRVYTSGVDYLACNFSTINNSASFNNKTNIYEKIQIRTSSGVTYNNFVIKPQLELNTSATSYEPYCGGTASPNPEFPQQIKNVTGDVNVKIQNKNLAWNGWAEDFVSRINDSSLASITTKDGKRCLKFDRTAGYGNYDTKYLFKTNWKENTQYTLSCDLFVEGSGSFANIQIRYTDGTISDHRYDRTENNWKKYTLVSTENKTVTDITVCYLSGINYIDLATFMVEQSPTATSYVEHEEQNLAFTLENAQKLMLGGSLQDDGIHNVRGQYIITGSERIVADVDGTNYKRFAIYFNGPTGIRDDNNKCNIAPNRTSSQGHGDYLYYMIIDKTIYFNFPKSIADTPEELGEWLATQYNNNQPIICEYKLAEEEITPYNSTQQEQYNAIKEAMSYYKQTNITSTSEEVGPIIDAEAIADMNSLLSDLETRLLTLESEV